MCTKAQRIHFIFCSIVMIVPEFKAHVCVYVLAIVDESLDFMNE